MRLSALFVLVLAIAPAVLHGEPPVLDALGDPLPPGAIARLGTERFRHPHDIDFLAFAPDGKNIVSGGYGGSACVWDAATGKLIRKLDDHPGRLLNGTFSPDGRLLAVADNTNEVFVWSLATGEVRFQLPGLARLRPAFSVDGKSLALYDAKKAVRIYDMASGKERHVVTPRDGPLDLALSPDGRRLAVAEIDDETNFSAVRLYDVATGKRLRSYDRKGSEFYQVTFTPDGKRLLGGDSVGNVCIWDFDSEEPIRVLEAPSGSPVVHLAITANGREVHVVTQNGKVGHYDLATGKNLAKFALEDETAKIYALSPDGQRLAVAHKDQFCVRDLATGKENPPAGQRWEFGRVVTWSPTGAQAAIETPDGGLLLWNPLEPGKPRPLAIENHRVVPSFSSDGKRVASLAQELISIHDVATEKEILAIPFKGVQYTLLGFSPVGETLALAIDRDIHLLDATTGKVRVLLRNAQGTRTTFTSDGRTLGVLDGEGGISLYETASGALRGRVELANRSDFFTFTPDGSALIVTNGSSGIRLVQVGTGKVLLRERERGPEIDALACSPGGNLLAIGGPDGSELWDLRTGRRVAQLAGHRGRVQALGFSADGKYLLTAGNDRLALVWDVARVLSQPAKPPEPPKRTLDDLWADLARPDSLRPFAAITALAERPETLPYLKERLHRANAPEPATLAKLLKDLTSDEFAARDRARTELLALDRQAEAALRKALATRPEPDAVRVLEELLAALEGPPDHPERLREIRAIELLERLGSPAAVETLQVLAGGATEARLTQEASQALARLKRRAAAR